MFDRGRGEVCYQSLKAQLTPSFIYCKVLYCYVGGIWNWSASGSFRHNQLWCGLDLDSIRFICVLNQITLLLKNVAIVSSLLKVPPFMINGFDVNEIAL